jgi:hypothetical protein
MSPDETKLNIKKYTEMREKWNNRATIFTATGKEWTNARTKHLTFCGGYNVPEIFRNISKRYLTCMTRDILQSHYPLWSTVLRITSTVPQSSEHTYPSFVETLVISVC